MDDEQAVTDLVVDVANVMGSRPDGWWRDRAGAAERLVRALAALPGRAVTGPDGRHVRVGAVHAVVEGQARGIPCVDGVEVVRAPTDGDTSVVLTCRGLVDRDAAPPPIAVTADRGLRERLPPQVTTAGPRWLLDRLARTG